jgi:predicted outer membrane lipoprotein
MSHDYVVLALCALGLLQLAAAVGLVFALALERMIW